jgi:hypothetical protein
MQQNASALWVPLFGDHSWRAFRGQDKFTADLTQTSLFDGPKCVKVRQWNRPSAR